MTKLSTRSIVAGAALLSATLLAGSASANPLGLFSLRTQQAPQVQGRVQDEVVTDGTEERVEMPAHLRRQTVSYPTREAPGTVIIDTANTYLYFVVGNGQAIRYGIGVGRDGFRWSGVKAIERKAEWPDWVPPAEMLARQPYLPRFMAGGPGNPLGARAMYLAGTVYRIHGTNQPATIGGRVSSGCIRMVNEDVIDLYGRVSVGAKVIVLNGERVARTPAQPAPTAYAPVRHGPAASVWQQIRPSGIY